jgi:ABC-type multidrug transport system fused ATPase/permease subunit
MSANISVGLTYWTDGISPEHPIHSYAYYAGLYTMLQVCAMISLLLLGITLWVFAIQKAGANLHQDALRTLIRAPLRFFTTTDTGVITNLFSQDLNLIDTELPDATLDTLFSVSGFLLDAIWDDEVALLRIPIDLP